MIAETCLTYLSFHTFEKWFSSNKKLETRLHLFDYAARNWGNHASGDVEQAIQPLILKFLKSNMKISCSARVTLFPEGRHSMYAQKTLKNVTGMHISAYFGLRYSMANLFESRVEPDSKDSSGGRRFYTLHWKGTRQ